MLHEYTKPERERGWYKYNRECHCDYCFGIGRTETLSVWLMMILDQILRK